MPRPATTARQKALANKQAAKKAEAAVKAEAEAQRKAEAAAKRAAKEVENDADDEEEDQPPATPAKGKAKAKGRAAAAKGKTPKKAKAAAPTKGKGKAAAAKKVNNAADDDDDDQLPATPKGKGKKAAATAPKKKAATPKKTAVPKKAAAAGRKRTAAQMEEEEDDEGDENDNNDSEEEEEDDDDDDNDAQQPPAKKAKTGPQGNPRVRRQSSVNNAIAKSATNPRKQLAGTKSAFEIPRKSASPPNYSSPPSSGPPYSSPPQSLARRSGSEANSEAGRLVRVYEQREARRKEKEREERNERQQKKGPPVEVSVRNGMDGVAKRVVQFDDDERPRRRGRGRQEDFDEKEEDDDIDREDEEMIDAERDERELQEIERAVTQALAQVGAAGLAQALEALVAPAPGAPAPEAAVAGGGGPDGDPSDISSSSDSLVSSYPSVTSEQTYQQTPNIQEEEEEVERLRTRLTQLRAAYDNRLQHSQAHNLPYTQGIFTRATGHPYGDPTSPEDLARDFAHLKFLVQKLVSKVPLDPERMAELTVELDDVKEEFRGLSSFWRNYWRPDRPVFARWLLEALIWRRLHRLIFDRQWSEYFAFGHGRGMLTELWVTSLAACVEVEFPESVDELCELRARLATFLKEMYEQESPSRMARAFEEVFCRSILDFLREDVEEDNEPGVYLHEERAEREMEIQELAVQIIDHASDLNSRMLRSSGNWALIYRDPRIEHRELYSYQFISDVMHVRDLEDEYVVRENPTGDLGPIQRDDEGGQVALTITPGLWDFTEWARIEIPFVVPHVRSEVSLQRHRVAVEKRAKEQRKLKKQKQKRAAKINDV